MTNSHGYLVEYPRIRVDHFDQGPIPLPRSLLAHRKAVLNHDADDDHFDAHQRHFPKPLVYLLTHIHTDHLAGLDRPGITAPIYCSFATKNLLLRYERQSDRVGYDNHHGRLVRPYAHLQVSDRQATAKGRLSGNRASAHDLLHPLPYNQPTEVAYTPRTRITITLLESNHMFGGTMFLVEGPRGAVLHTGDLRAEGWWCEALVRNAAISRYIAWNRNIDVPGVQPSNLAARSDQAWAEAMQQQQQRRGSSGSSGRGSGGGRGASPSRSTTAPARGTGTSRGPAAGASTSQDTDPCSDQDTQDLVDRHRAAAPFQSLRLENIYLDTEMLLSTQPVPSKERALQDMVTLLRAFPPDTVFYLNSWTWGYEGMLKAVAKAFGCRVHVDRFKAGMYRAARCEDPFLSQIITLDPDESRFHACERKNMCDVLLRSPASAREAILQPSAHVADDSSLSGRRDLPPEERWGPAEDRGDGPLVVFVNPAQISEERWADTFEQARGRLEYARQGRTSWPRAVLVPLERHSPLPELQRFVDLFRPRTVSPNTILDVRGGLDYYLLHSLFGPYIAKGGADRLAAEGLALLGDRQWAFFERQIQMARHKASKGGQDSIEGHASGSDPPAAAPHSRQNSDGTAAAVKAAEVEALVKTRGISLKAGTMHNMAGNVAALLEIERWRRHEGMAEGVSFPASISAPEESSWDLSESGNQSGATAGYDADQSQAAEMTLRPTSPRCRPRQPSPAKQQGVHQASASAATEGERSSSPKTGNGAGVEEATTTGRPPEPPTPSSDEALASRYLNILIHHFRVHYIRRAGITYVDMWREVRRRRPNDAAKVEQLCQVEQGIQPPAWTLDDGDKRDGNAASSGIHHHHQQQQQQRRPSPKAAAAEATSPGPTTGQPTSMEPEVDDGASLHALETVLELLEAPSDEDLPDELGDQPEDHAIGYRILLGRFRAGQICQLQPVEGTDSLSLHQGSGSRQPSTRGWHPLASRLFATLDRDLRRVLTILTCAASGDDLHSIDDKMATFDLGEQAIKVVALVLACRQVSRAFTTEELRGLCSGLLALIEIGHGLAASPAQTRSPGDDGHDPDVGMRRILALSTFALQNEELHREVLEPLEQRLVAAADGPMRRMVLSIPPETGRVLTSAAPPGSESCGGGGGGSPTSAAAATRSPSSPSPSSPEPSHTIRQLIAARTSRRTGAGGNGGASALTDGPTTPPRTPTRRPTSPPAEEQDAHRARGLDESQGTNVSSSTLPEESTQEEPDVPTGAGAGAGTGAGGRTEELFPSLEHLSASTRGPMRGTRGPLPAHRPRRYWIRSVV
ncbi:uncharacterized protein PSFLO_04454 [Pseudozyma flocculosa]|uniref:Metallo-beta-lactamase domain-containing protein n=1 Tax=Pseudozyma flocculosa TaxID=84751 RepID=A0A5C3F4W7_9BASI|nr:uncharacterized protein PSFLO_04454 [Pseudozyma flocculosa]